MNDNLDRYPLYSPEDSYLDNAWEKISHLPEDSLLFTDVEGTASDIHKGVLSVREDFNQLYDRVRQERDDIDMGIMTYRSENTGIPELEQYEFSSRVFAEDIYEVLDRTPIHEIAASVIDGLSSMPENAHNRRLAQEIIESPALKVQFLFVMFRDYVSQVFLIDDSVDGELAERIGIGHHVGKKHTSYFFLYQYGFPFPVLFLPADQATA